MNQARLAYLLRVRQSTVSQYETGRIEPSVPVLARIYEVANESERRVIAAEVAGDVFSTEEVRQLLRELRDTDALLTSIYEENLPPEFSKFAIAVSSVLHRCSSIDGSITEMLELWVKHHGSNSAIGYFRDATAFLRVQLAKFESSEPPASPPPAGQRAVPDQPRKRRARSRVAKQSPKAG